MFIIAVLLLNYGRDCSLLDNAFFCLLTKNFCTTLLIQDASPATQGVIDQGVSFSVDSIHSFV